MSKLWMLGIAFLLLLAAFPLVSLGTTGENDTLWWVGLALLVVGGLIPAAARFAAAEDDDAEEEERDRENDTGPSGRKEEG